MTPIKNVLRETTLAMTGSSALDKWKPPPPCETAEERAARIERAALRVRGVDGWEVPDPDEGVVGRPKGGRR